MPPLVSVIVAAFNGERFLGEALESALRQDHGAKEVVVCDDGSTDGTAAILAGFGDRIRVLRQANQGVSAARNACAAAARGSILAFLDQDDRWLPGKLSRQVRHLTADPGLSLVWSDSWIIDGDGRTRGRRSEWHQIPSGPVFRALIPGNFIPIETVAMSADAFRQLGGFSLRWRYLEDWDLCLRVAQRHRLARDPEPLACYRIHGGNLSHDREEMESEAAELLGSLAADPATDPPLRVLLERETGRRLGLAAWLALRRRDFDAARRRLDRAGARCPGRLAFRVRAVAALLRSLPAPLAEGLIRKVRKRSYYGVRWS